MAQPLPIVLYGGELKQLSSGDALNTGRPWNGKVMQWSHCTGYQGQGTGDFWGNYISTGTAAVATYPNVPDRLGVVQLNTVTTAAAGGRVMAQTYTNTHAAKSGIEQAVLGVVRPVNVLFGGTLTGEIFVGLATDPTLSFGTNALGIRSRNGGNWTLVCRSGGVETTQDLGIAAPLNTWVTPEVRFTSSSVRALINGAAVGTPIMTNIPTATLYAVIGPYKSAASAASPAPALQVDVAAYYEV